MQNPFRILHPRSDVEFSRRPEGTLVQRTSLMDDARKVQNYIPSPNILET